MAMASATVAYKPISDASMVSRLRRPADASLGANHAPQNNATMTPCSMALCDTCDISTSNLQDRRANPFNRTITPRSSWTTAWISFVVECERTRDRIKRKQTAAEATTTCIHDTRNVGQSIV